MRRVSRWTLVISVFMSTATVVFVIVRGPLGIPRSGVWRFVPLMMGMSPIVVVMPIGHWMLRGIRRDWHTAAGRLCTHCAYDVSDLAPAGTCPECGGAYDIAKDASIWAASGLQLQPPREANSPRDSASSV